MHIYILEGQLTSENLPLDDIIIKYIEKEERIKYLGTNINEEIIFDQKEVTLIKI